MLRVNFNGDWLDMSNISIAGEARTGRTNLVKYLAKGLMLRRPDLRLIVVTNDAIAGWEEFCNEFPGRSDIHFAGYEILEHIYDEVFNVPKTKTLVIFDCVPVCPVGAINIDLLQDWKQRCQEFDNYGIFITNTMCIRRLSDIKVNTVRVEGDTFSYTCVVRGDKGFSHTICKYNTYSYTVFPELVYPGGKPLVH